MGAMVAIKPKAFVTEAFFIANASKALAANWGAQDAHKPLTDALTWETAMTFAVAQGFFMGLCVKLPLAGTPRGGAKRADGGKKRTQGPARERVGVSARRGAPSRFSRASRVDIRVRPPSRNEKTSSSSVWIMCCNLKE